MSVDDNDKPLCIGFGDREGRCLNDAGSTHSQLWCQECDDARRAHIGAQLDALTKFYETPEWDGLPISIKIGRGKYGWWWAVYFGDSDIPGSLWGGAGTYEDIGACYAEAYQSYLSAFDKHPPRYIEEDDRVG